MGKSRAEGPPPASTGRPPPVRDDQPTIISNRPPMATGPVSDSAHRVFQGKIVPGDRLGHFELVECVGGGGMGRVFRAVDTRLGRTVALKILPPDRATDEEILSRFQNEAQSAARLDHDNIARVYYVGEDRGLHYIVFEFIEGVNVRDMVQRKGPLSLAEAVSYTLQVAEALAHAASREVVHRDIKPSNVLITPEGQVKLIDMGLARLRAEDVAAADLTASGVTLGTFDYISPEQARDPRTADVRSDLYSLGCTFFYMLAGRPPFPEGTVLQKLLQHQGDQPPDVRHFRPGLPDEVARVLRKMLAKDPRHRPREPAELVEDLLSLAEQVGLRPVGPGSRILVPPREAKVSLLHWHLPWIAPIAALVCIVLLLDFLWSSSARRNDRLIGEREGSIVERQSAEPSGTTPVAPESPPEAPPGKPNGQPPQANGAGRPRPPEGANDVTSTVPSEPNAVTASSHDTVETQTPAAGLPASPTGPNPLDCLLGLGTGAGGLEFDPFTGGASAGEDTSGRFGMALDSRVPLGYLSGATGAAAESTGAAPVVEPVPARAGLLVVNQRAEGPGEFRTLGAACSKAESGDVIELRYNGRRQQRPIKLDNLKVTIRGGEGYRPLIAFRPGETEMDPVQYPRSMFTVASGRLTLVNVALELDVPREVPAEGWSLFETRGGQTVRLEKCSLTICNASDQLSAYHQEVAFFRVQSAPGADAVMTNGTPAARPLAVIELAHCIARGEAVFLKAQDAQPVRLAWENGLLVTSERLLSACGGQEIPQAGEVLQIDLRHVTAVVRSGLCRMVNDSQRAPYQLTARIHCADSILVAAEGSSLIEQVGAESMEDFRQRIVWNGDRNFYNGFERFWTINDLDPKTPPHILDFAAWQSYWGSEDENLPNWDEVQWRKLPEADRPLHAHSPGDYALEGSTSENPAIGAASDGSNAGFLTPQLPPLPAPPKVEKPMPAENRGRLNPTPD